MPVVSVNGQDPVRASGVCRWSDWVSAPFPTLLSEWMPSLSVQPVHAWRPPWQPGSPVSWTRGLIQDFWLVAALLAVGMILDVCALPNGPTTCVSPAMAQGSSLTKGKAQYQLQAEGHQKSLPLLFEQKLLETMRALRGRTKASLVAGNEMGFREKHAGERDSLRG